MSDLSMPNAAPGRCCKCNGSGEYRWGAIVNGRAERAGPCFSCRGSGRQDRRQIARNHTFNRYQIARIVGDN